MNEQQRLEIAKREARRYSHMSWVDVNEAAQEALLAMLQAERTFERKGKNNQQELAEYVTKAAQYAVRWHVWTALSPLKHGNRGEIAKQATAVKREDTETLLDHAEDAEGADSALADDEWRAQVRARLAELLGDDPDVDQLIAWCVLMEGDTPEQVAKQVEVKPRAVYVVTHRIRNRILKDEQMRSLLSQLKR